MMYEINNELFKELKYEFNESNQKETELKYQKKTSQMNLKQEKITNYSTINNNNKIDNTNQNNQKYISTKCYTEYNNIYKEADKEEILR